MGGYSILNCRKNVHIFIKKDPSMRQNTFIFIASKFKRVDINNIYK